jgi:hypothetical protein
MLTKIAAATVVSLASLALAQPDGPMPGLNPNPKDTNNPRLVGKQFLFRELPYQADTTSGDRGPQTGYNQCNSTTQGPGSMCQTLIANSIEDFCLWGPPERGTVGEKEGESVAWCTKPTHGARLIPAGTLKSVQFYKAPSYVSIVGFIDQEKLNIPGDDEGGEYDSGGADQRGNPVGSLVYSNSLPSTKGVLSQSRMWHSFMGSNMFCMKFCDEKAPNASGLCRHTFDEIGCYPNVPSDYEGNKGTFLSCDSEDQDPVTPDNTRIPKSSNCVTYESTKIFPELPTDAPAPGGTTTTTGTDTQPTSAPTEAPSQSGSDSSSGTQTTRPVTPIKPSPAPTTSSDQGPAGPSPSDGAAVSTRSASVGVVGAIALLAGALFA